MQLTPSQLTTFADAAGISIGVSGFGPHPTQEQLAAFAAQVQAACAEECLSIALKHQQNDGPRASGLKAGALECYDALK